MQRARWMPAACSGLAWIALAATAWAQSPHVIPSRPIDEPRISLIVLTSGQSFSGDVEQRPEGYLVRMENGEVLVPYGMVQVAAESLPDAYLRMRDNLTAPTANQRLELARWCRINKLYDEARAEVLAALQLEPDRREARLLLRELEAEHPALANSDPLLSTTTTSGHRSPEKLSGELRAQFVQRIQPLLLNRCGNAACHGTASTSSLRLNPVAAGRRLSRLETDRNLQEIVRYINEAQPMQSPLLVEPLSGRDPHHSVFAGPHAAVQQDLLESWVRRAARELGQSRPARAGFNSATTRADLPTSIDDWPAETPQTASGFRHMLTGGTTANDLPAAPEARSHSFHAGAEQATMIPNRLANSPATGTDREGPQWIDEQFLRKVLAEDEPDAFDPDVFNRRVHGIEASAARRTATRPAGQDPLTPR